MSRAHLLALAFTLGACADRTPSKQPAIRFLHTFGPEETELVNELFEQRGLTVESSLVPFARGQQVISEILAAGKDCPDAIRIDATWLPALQQARLLAPIPDALAKLDWLPEAAALATIGGVAHAVPQAVDGLVVVRDASRPPPASPSIDDLIAAARATKTPRNPYPLGVRVDGYWFVPWLRTHGGELASRGIAGDEAIHALEKFAALFGDVASPPPPAGSEAPDELRRWRMGALAYWITGPWQLGSLEDRERLAITPLSRAPRGGQLLVVPACAKRPDAGWKLAAELTDVAAGTRLASAFGTVPTRRATLEASPPLARSVYEALRAAEPLPRDPITPLLFDDLNPALTAVVFHDATAAEAIEGVRRGWQRLPASASSKVPAP